MEISQELRTPDISQMATSIKPLPATLPAIHQNSKGKGIVVHVHILTSGGEEKYRPTQFSGGEEKYRPTQFSTSVLDTGLWENSHTSSCTLLERTTVPTE